MPDPDADLPQMLGAAFTAFDAIRQSARSYEDRDRDLFPAFFSAGTAAANGRDAVLTATLVPSDVGSPPGFTQPAPDANPNDAADAIAASAAILSGWLDKARSQATTAQDQAACQDAVAAARQIQHLMAADDTHSR
jgi:hypothetical protein